jgi:hypothetical protein
MRSRAFYARACAALSADAKSTALLRGDDIWMDKICINKRDAEPRAPIN